MILNCLSESAAARPTDAAQIIARLEHRPLRKMPIIGVAVVVIAASITPIRDRVIDWFTPANMRLAILPFQGPTEATVIGAGALEDVSDRLRHLPSARRTLSVIPLTGELENSVKTPEQAYKVLHATHALQPRCAAKATTTLWRVRLSTWLRRLTFAISPAVILKRS